MAAVLDDYLWVMCRRRSHPTPPFRIILGSLSQYNIPPNNAFVPPRPAHSRCPTTLPKTAQDCHPHNAGIPFRPLAGASSHHPPLTLPFLPLADGWSWWAHLRPSCLGSAPAPTTWPMRCAVAGEGAGEGRGGRTSPSCMRCGAQSQGRAREGQGGRASPPCTQCAEGK